ncbi:MAG: hypothetical protein SD837_07775 [Candidatus Electrothrix scaldis]|nr:MAG: hypothetical protein SD837_07775 [Candidatus Electrothrix sp. GW3-3]
MSTRFGWIVIGKNLESDEQQIISDFRKHDPVKTSTLHATEYLMKKVDDEYELGIGFGKNFTIIQGQYDLGLNIWDDIDLILKKYSTETVAIYIAVEGTSGSELYKKYKNGTLEQSFASYEGEVSPDECFGVAPKGDEEFGQVDEWSLISEIEKEGIMYDAISDITFSVRNYDISMSESTKPLVSETKKWWQFWK